MAGHPLDRSMEPYYERRSAEYDDWYLGAGLFAERDRPGWDEERPRADRGGGPRSLRRSAPLDVACGTGFLTQTPARPRRRDRCERRDAGRVARRGTTIRSFAPTRSRCPSGDDSFDRVFTGHFYGHLHPGAARAVPGRRAGGSRRSSSSSTRRSTTASSPSRSQERDPERRVVASRVQALLHGRRSSRTSSEAAGCVFDGRWFVVVSSRR